MNDLHRPADNDDEPEGNAGAATKVEKAAKHAPQIDDAEKRRLAETASRESDA